jgi:hypothetical protein
MVEAPPSTYPKWREPSAFKSKLAPVLVIKAADLSAAAFEITVPFAS